MKAVHPRPSGLIAVLVAATLWAGLLLGIAFIATPVKFLAPSLTLAAALDVGRYTFWALNRLELACALVVVVLVLSFFRTATGMALAVVLAAIVLAETFWLLPALDLRTGMVMAGRTPPPSALHEVYIGLEILKLVLLVALAAVSARRLLRVTAALGRNASLPLSSQEKT